MKTRAADQIGIKREETHYESNDDSGGRESRYRAIGDPFVPIINREQSKADKRNRIPVRRRNVIEREQKIKRGHRQSKPEQEQDFELLIDAPPAADHRPDQKSEEDRRIKNEMFAEKFERLERSKANVFRQSAARP